jgi:N-acetylglucosamine-6-sulfatase
MHLDRAPRPVAAVCLLAAALLTLAHAALAQQTQPPTRPPNIVFVLSDDEDLGIHAFMPNVKALIEDQGAVFENLFTTYPLCCPSRASILRGQYPHNTLVLGNLPPEGGFLTFRRLGLEESTIATWLHAAGYRTAFYGKYLNGYTETDAPPPGWDEWHAANNDGYFNVNYKLNENGKVVAYGGAPEDYLTDVIAAKAVAHIRRFAAEGRPFFLYVATFAPHSPYNPAPRHKGLFQEAELPRPPTFNEDDVSDKPGFIQELARLNEDQIAEITTHYRQRLECLQAVDELVAALVDALEDTGELGRTYLVYASDNGFHLGLHRMLEGKDTAYEEDIRVPLAVRGPGIPKGRKVKGMALNIDLAPTFAAWAGVEPPAFVDGRSLMPLLGHPGAPWRRSFLIQRLGLESDERLEPANALAIRTERHTYIAYNNGEREMYDLATDPDQLQSIEPTADQALIEALAARLTQLHSCEGQQCRDLEDLPVE